MTINYWAQRDVREMSFDRPRFHMDERCLLGAKLAGMDLVQQSLTNHEMVTQFTCYTCEGFLKNPPRFEE